MFLRCVHDLLCFTITWCNVRCLDGLKMGSEIVSLPLSSLIGGSKTSIKLCDITDLANMLFDQLEKEFERLFSDMGQPAPPTLTESHQEGLILNLRCCMVVLEFFEFNMGLVVQKCEILLSILRRLCVPNLSFPHCSCKLGAGVDNVHRGVAGFVPLRCPNVRISTNDMNEETRRPMLSFFRRVLEVFIEEILMNCQMRKHFMMTDSVSSTTQKLFVSRGSYADIIQEIICSHFLLSANDEWSFNNFINLLSGEEVEDVSELRLSSVLSLLGTRKMCSIPCMLEAHLLLLASKCIHMQRPGDDQRLHCEMMNCHLYAFELSVNVYVDYFSRLKFVDNTNGRSAQSSLCPKKLHFDSCIQSVTCNRLQHQMDCLADFCRLKPHGCLSGRKEDIASKSLAYIKKNCRVLDDGMWQDETHLILKYMILNILSEENAKYTKSGNDDEIGQELFCVAAVVKLMSSSLLQIIWNLRQKGLAGGIKTLGGKSSFKEYNFITDIISCFGKYDSDPFAKRILLDFIGANPAKHESILMFAHFASLLYFSFRRRNEVLWNNCIMIMMTILKLIIFEEGNLDVLMPLVVKSKKMFDLSSPGKASRARKHRSPSTLVASKIQAIQKLYLTYDPECLVKDQWNNRRKEQESQPTLCPTSVEVRTGEANGCNGENYVRHLPGYSRNPSAFDDLVDFIECKKDKDYSSWLKNRRAFRGWHYEKRRRMKSLKKAVPMRKFRSRKTK